MVPPPLTEDGPEHLLQEAFITSDGLTRATQERLLASIIFVAAVLLLGLLSHMCSGAVQRVALALLNGIVVALCVLSLFGTGMLVIPIMAASVPLFGVAPKLYYAIVDTCWTPMWALCILYAEVFGGTRMIFQGDVPIHGESALVLANHLGELDWVVMLSLAARMRCLSGMRFLMKAAFAKMPILGWGLALHHGVFIRSRPDGRTNAKVLASETSADAVASGDAPTADRHQLVGPLPLSTPSADPETGSTTPRTRARLVAEDTSNVTTTVQSLLGAAAECHPVWMGIFPEVSSRSACNGMGAFSHESFAPFPLTEANPVEFSLAPGHSTHPRSARACA